MYFFIISLLAAFMLFAFLRQIYIFFSNAADSAALLVFLSALWDSETVLRHFPLAGNIAAGRDCQGLPCRQTFFELLHARGTLMNPGFIQPPFFDQTEDEVDGLGHNVALVLASVVGYAKHVGSGFQAA